MSKNLQWSQLGPDMSVVADSAGKSASVMRQQPFLGQKPPAPKYIVTADGIEPREFYIEREATAAAEAFVLDEVPITVGTDIQWTRLGADASVVVDSNGNWAVVMRQGPFLGQSPPVPKYVVQIEGQESQEFYVEREARAAAETFIRARNDDA